MDLKLEAIVLPVSDVDRARSFYEKAGFRLDIDFTAGEDYRAVQFTPPGSAASIMFGKGLTAAAPGSSQGLHFIVSDIEKTRAELVDCGIEVSEVFHDAEGLFRHSHDRGRVVHAAEDGRVRGLHPERASYGSYADFHGPDGNGWVLQEITERLPGH